MGGAVRQRMVNFELQEIKSIKLLVDDPRYEFQCIKSGVLTTLHSLGNKQLQICQIITKFTINTQKGVFFSFTMFIWLFNSLTADSNMYTLQFRANYVTLFCTP